MDALNAIFSRYSCRAYSDRVPSQEDLETIARAAAAAPSGMNLQPWQILMIRNPELMADLENAAMETLSALPDKGMYERIMSRGGKVYYNAPCMAIIAVEQDGWKPGAQMMDCGIVAENIAVAATALGIDNVICGMIGFAFAGEAGEALKQRIRLPEGYEIGVAVLLGYGLQGGTPHAPDMAKITWVD